MNRREILKRFGIGAVIVPIIGGAADTSSAAELVQVPKVRPVELFQRIDTVDLGKVSDVEVVLKMRDGSRHTLGIPENGLTYGDGMGKITAGDQLRVDMTIGVEWSSPLHQIAEFHICGARLK